MVDNRVPLYDVPGLHELLGASQEEFHRPEREVAFYSASWVLVHLLSSTPEWATLLGRLTADAVTTLGSGVDGTVRRMETAYDTQGNAYLFTSYNAASGGTALNQVEKKDVVVRLCDEQGKPIISWKIVNAFPTKLDAPSFDAKSNEVAVESMELRADAITITEA